MRRVGRAAVIGLFALGTVLGEAAPALAGNMTIGSGSSFSLGTSRLLLGCADLDVLGTFSAGTVGFTQGRDITITPGGVMDGGSATLQLSGDWDNLGIFVPGTSTVRITDGCGLLSGVINGNSAFNNLELSTASGKQVSFTAGSTQNVTGTFVAGGSGGFFLRIRSTIGGVAAFLNAMGPATAVAVDVQDNDALAGNDVFMSSGSIKGPNSPGWVLTGPIPLLPPLAALLVGAALVASARRRLLPR